MKIKSLKNKLEKLGYSVNVIIEKKYSIFSEKYITTTRYEVKSSTHILTWFPSFDNTDVSNLHVRRLNDKSEIQSDYFAGWFPKTIKHAVNALTTEEK